ncbi:acyltransferase [Vibrio metschnikovii]|nr:acyltransferase [Vibrio metschnikovii]EKO3604053.1 acyltransferase [Vibrio metschnikovii]EKQ5811428.1 acyltransferase [Vibrio metschnikovii]
MLSDELKGLEFMGDNFKGKLNFCGDGVRLYPLCKMIRAENAKLDNHCQIFDHVFIDAGKEFVLGKYSTLTWQVLVEGGARAIIGDRVFVGPGSKLLTSTYKINGFYTVEHLPEGCQETEYGDIIIEDDAYIGANCTIMPGVTIGEGAVVGVNSFVRKNLEPWTVYIGNPCKAIGKREKPTNEKTELLNNVDWSNHL